MKLITTDYVANFCLTFGLKQYGNTGAEVWAQIRKYALCC